MGKLDQDPPVDCGKKCFTCNFDICVQCVDPVKMGQIYKQLKKFSRYPVFTLKDVGRLIKKLLGKYTNELYQVWQLQFFVMGL